MWARSAWTKPGALLAALCLGTSALPAAAAEPCQLRLLHEPEELLVEYDPFSPAPATRQAELELANDGASPCRLQFELLAPGSRDGRLTLPGPAIAAELFLSHPGQRPGAALQLALPADARAQLAVGALLRPGAYPLPGTYEHTLGLQVRDLDSGALLQRELPLRLRVAVVPRAQLNIAGSSVRPGTSGVSQIDFGVLRPGAQRRVVAQVRANAAYRLSVRSTHGGELRHAERPEFAGIPYSVTLAGHSSTLQAPLVLDRRRPTSAAGDALPLDFRIEQFEGRMAGEYQDVVEISVQALY